MKHFDFLLRVQPTLKIFPNQKYEAWRRCARQRTQPSLLEVRNGSRLRSRLCCYTLKSFFFTWLKTGERRQKKSYQVHLNDVSCHKLGPVHQAVRPSHLNHLTLRRWSKLGAVSVLTGKKQTKFKETWKEDKYLMQPDMKYGSVSCSDARVKCEALDDVWITPEAYNQELLCNMTVWWL